MYLMALSYLIFSQLLVVVVLEVVVAAEAQVAYFIQQANQLVLIKQ